MWELRDTHAYIDKSFNLPAMHDLSKGINRNTYTV